MPVLETNELSSLAEAQAELMRRHQQMIKDARARDKEHQAEKADGSVKIVKTVETAPTVKETVGSVAIDEKIGVNSPPAIPSEPASGLFHFLKNATQKTDSKKNKTVSDDMPWCDSTMVSSSTEMTVATADSDCEQVLHDIYAALQHQQGRVASLENNVESHEDLAQARYMSRDKVGAAKALRQAHLQRYRLVHEVAVAEKLDSLSRELRYASFDKDEEGTVFQQILDNAIAARASLPTQVKVSDGVLLEEIQKMIRSL